MSYYVTSPLVFPRPLKFRFSVHEATSRSERRRFVKAPWRIYREDLYWVPPPVRLQRNMLEPARNPLLEGAEIALFVAEASGALTDQEVVGTVAGLICPRCNESFGENLGFFAVFEVINNGEVARALLEAVEEWVLEHLPGAAAIHGPVALDLLHAPGVLADGFDARPAPLMPYHAPYYGELIEAAGYEPVAEWVSYTAVSWARACPFTAFRACPFTPFRACPECNEGASSECNEGASSEPSALRACPEPVEGASARRLVEGSPDRSACRPAVRLLEGPALMAERTRLVSLSVAAWRPVWGITPPRETEISYALNSLFRWRPAVMAAMAEEAGEPVGAALAVPDAIPLLSGWPAGRKPRCMRIFPACVLPKRPGQGIEALLYGRLIEAIAGRGYRYAEFAPFASDDEAAAAVLSGLGARKGKRYREYEKRFALYSQPSRTNTRPTPPSILRSARFSALLKPGDV